MLALQLQYQCLLFPLCGEMLYLQIQYDLQCLPSFFLSHFRLNVQLMCYLREQLRGLQRQRMCPMQQWLFSCQQHLHSLQFNPSQLRNLPQWLSLPHLPKFNDRRKQLLPQLSFLASQPTLLLGCNGSMPALQSHYSLLLNLQFQHYLSQLLLSLLSFL